MVRIPDGPKKQKQGLPNALGIGPAKLGDFPSGFYEFMPRKLRKSSFDPKLFLAKVGEGKAILKFDKSQVVFSQGDAADTVFHIQKGKIKVLVVSEQGKEAVVGIMEPGQFFGEGYA